MTMLTTLFNNSSNGEVFCWLLLWNFSSRTVHGVVRRKIEQETWEPSPSKSKLESRFYCSAMVIRQIAKRQLPDACSVRRCNGFELHMTILRFLLLDFWLLRFRSSYLIIVMMHSWASCVKWSVFWSFGGTDAKADKWSIETFRFCDYRIMTNCSHLSPDQKTLSHSKSGRRCTQCIRTGKAMFSGWCYRRSGNSCFMWWRFWWNILREIWIRVDELKLRFENFMTAKVRT